MSIAELLNEALEDKVDGNKSEMARRLDVSRPTLDNWLFSVHKPEFDRAALIASVADREYAYVLAVMLSDRGIDTSIFKALANFATGVHVSSNFLRAANGQIAV